MEISKKESKKISELINIKLNGLYSSYERAKKCANDKKNTARKGWAGQLPKLTNEINMLEKILKKIQ